MKNTKKIFVSLLCILLSVLVASATLMVGATDDAASETATSSTESVTYTLVPSTAVVTTTQKEITDIISEVISKNDWQDDLSEAGSEVVEASSKIETFLNDFIEAIESFAEKFLAFFKQIFKVADFG